MSPFFHNAIILVTLLLLQSTSCVPLNMSAAPTNMKNITANAAEI